MKNENWTAPPDGACVNCRARKVRCGRERPSCGNCRRDGGECVYSSPAKRVNHVKVLCQNFDDMQSRLIMVQEDLSVLTRMFKETNIAARLKSDLPNDHFRDRDRDRDLPLKATDSDCSDDTAGQSVGHIFRDAGTLIEQYHGRWTLVSQCHDFAADVKLSILPKSNEIIHEVIEGHIRKLTQDAVVGDSADFGKVAAGEAVRLPSKQFLSAILETFFKLIDHNTDIFEPQITYEALERVYKEPLAPSSEAWAVCFNLIILLVLGAESPTLIDDPFIRPALQASQVAIKKSSISLGPKLINVQTLALLSLFAHHCQNEDLGDRLFMQACILAKAMGLDQYAHGLQPPGLSEIEATERKKVYGSLFIRDQHAAVTRGTISWLPYNSNSISSVNLHDDNDRAGSNCQSRHDLARLQNELQTILSPEALRSQDQRIALCELRDRLMVWSREMNVPSSTAPSTTENVSIHLTFLSTRIRLNQTLYSCDTGVSNQLLQDSRLCCLLLVASCCRPVPYDLWHRLQSLLGEAASMASPTQSHPPVFTSSSSSSSSASASLPLAAPDSADIPEHAQLRPALSIHRLWASFPPAAVFILARNIMRIHLVPPSSSSRKPPRYQRNDNQQCAEAHQDLVLIDTLRQVTQPADTAAIFRLSSCTNKLGTVIEDIVELLSAATKPRGNVMDTLTPTSLLLQDTSRPFDMESLESYGLSIQETAGLPWPELGAPGVVSTSKSGYSSADSKCAGDEQVDIPQFLGHVTMEDMSWPIEFSDGVVQGYRGSRFGAARDESSSRGRKRPRESAGRGNSSDYTPGSRHSN